MAVFRAWGIWYGAVDGAHCVKHSVVCGLGNVWPPAMQKLNSLAIGQEAAQDCHHADVTAISCPPKLPVLNCPF